MFKLIFAAAFSALPLAASAQPSSYGYDARQEIDPAARTTTDSSTLDRDRQDLIDARHRADDLATQRDQQQRIVDSMIHGDRPASGSVSVTPTGDVKALQQQFDDAKAKADKIHADAVARFEAGDTWKSEFARFDAARRDLKGPTDDVLNRVSQTPEFKELVAAARSAKERADKLHGDKNADPKAVKDADDAFMAADNRVQEAAEHALQDDPKVVAGRKIVDDEQAKLHDLRDKFEQDLINDAAFASAVQEVRARQEALDAATGHTGASQDASAAPISGDLRNAQDRLDQLNHDLDQARNDVDSLTDRVRWDEENGQATASNYNYNDNAAPDYRPYDSGPAYAGEDGYPYGYQPPYAYEPVAVPVYAPVVAYDSYDWWSPGLSFGFSFGSYGYHDRWCDDWYGRWCRPYSSYYRGYGDYYGYYGRGGYYGHGGYYDHERRYGDRYSYGYGGRGNYSRGDSYRGRSYSGRSYSGRSYSGHSYSGDYYAGARYGGANRYGYSSGRSYSYGNTGRSSSRDYSGSYAGRSTYAGRSAYEGRSQYTGRDTAAAYRDRVERRSAAVQPDRQVYQRSAERRSVESPRSASVEPRYQSRSVERGSQVTRETPHIARASRSESGSVSRESHAAYSGRERASESSSSRGSSSHDSSSHDSSSRGSSSHDSSSHGRSR